MRRRWQLRQWLVVVAVGSAVAVLVASLVWRFFVAASVDPRLDEAGDRRIQVRVLNAAGVPQLARTVQQYLRRRGFDVVDVATAPALEPRSSIVDHVGDSAAVAQVQTALGIATVRRDIDSDLVLHCSVVLGADWKTLRPFR